jgi:hypothetical protein
LSPVAPAILAFIWLIAAEFSGAPRSGWVYVVNVRAFFTQDRRHARRISRLLIPRMLCRWRKKVPDVRLTRRAQQGIGNGVAQDVASLWPSSRGCAATHAAEDQLPACDERCAS